MEADVTSSYVRLFVEHPVQDDSPKMPGLMFFSTASASFVNLTSFRIIRSFKSGFFPYPIKSILPPPLIKR